MTSFANAQGYVKIRLACSKTLLLIISSSNIVARFIYRNCLSEKFTPCNYYNYCIVSSTIIKKACANNIFITASNLKERT